MKSLIAPQYGEPSIYEIATTADPVNGKPTDILINVAAASINGHDVIMASGKTKMLQNVPIPYRIGLDFAGTVAAVGSSIADYNPGDRVYGFHMQGGAAATQVLLDTTKPYAMVRIPEHTSFAQASSLPAVGVTGLKALERADKFFAAEGGLQGKTVFIPGALSGVGSIALQIAKHKYDCRTITAVSTTKLPQVEQYLGSGIADTILDYTKVNIAKELGKGAVDFVLDTTGLAAEYIPMIRKGGFCLSIARIPPGSALKNEDADAPQQSRMMCIGQNFMDGIDATFRVWAKTMHSVTYVYQKTDPDQRALEQVNELVAAGKVCAVVGKTASLSDLDEVKSNCTAILKGKGGIGKFVIEMSQQ